jgi:hypothetical protein
MNPHLARIVERSAPGIRVLAALAVWITSVLLMIEVGIDRDPRF